MKITCTDCGSQDFIHKNILDPPYANSVILRNGEVKELVSKIVCNYRCTNCGETVYEVDKPTVTLEIFKSGRQRIKSCYLPTRKRVLWDTSSDTKIIFLEDFNYLDSISDVEALKMLHPEVNAAIVMLYVKELILTNVWSKKQMLYIDIPTWEDKL